MPHHQQKDGFHVLEFYSQSAHSCSRHPNLPLVPEGHRPSALCGPINPLSSNLMSRGTALDISSLKGKRKRDPTALQQPSSKGSVLQIPPIQHFLQAGDKWSRWQNQFSHILSMSRVGGMASHFRIWGYPSSIMLDLWDLCWNSETTGRAAFDIGFYLYRVVDQIGLASPSVSEMTAQHRQFCKV